MTWGNTITGPQANPWPPDPAQTERAFAAAHWGVGSREWAAPIARVTS